jgi:hypothetical protein
VVGHGDGRHAGPLALAEQVLEPGGAVQHGVLGVHVKMRKRAVSPVSRRRHVQPPSWQAPAGRRSAGAGGSGWRRPRRGSFGAGSPARAGLPARLHEPTERRPP